MGAGREAAGPPGWGGRGGPVGGAFAADVLDVPPIVMLVCPEVWLLLCTVPPVVWDVLRAERLDWVCDAVPAGPDLAPLGCLCGAVLSALPAGPGRDTHAPGFGAAVPAGPGRVLPDVWEGLVPAAPGADGVPMPDGGT